MAIGRTSFRAATTTWRASNDRRSSRGSNPPVALQRHAPTLALALNARAMLDAPPAVSAPRESIRRPQSHGRESAGRPATSGVMQRLELASLRRVQQRASHARSSGAAWQRRSVRRRLRRRWRPAAIRAAVAHADAGVSLSDGRRTHRTSRDFARPAAGAGVPKPSMYGTSMPAAAWVAPRPAPRASSTVTDAPRDASSYAIDSPMTPAPMIATSQSRHNPLSSHARQGAPFEGQAPPEGTVAPAYGRKCWFFTCFGRCGWVRPLLIWIPRSIPWIINRAALGALAVFGVVAAGGGAYIASRQADESSAAATREASRPGSRRLRDRNRKQHRTSAADTRDKCGAARGEERRSRRAAVSTRTGDPSRDGCTACTTGCDARPSRDRVRRARHLRRSRAHQSIRR